MLITTLYAANSGGCFYFFCCFVYNNAEFGQLILKVINILVKFSIITPDKETIQRLVSNAKESQFSQISNTKMTNLEDTQMDGEKTLNKPRDCPVRDANDDDLMRPFNPYTVIATASHFDAHDSAQFWQKTIWVFLFLVISLFQAYIGIKIVFFKVNSSLIFYISIYTINILLSHIELYFTKQYIDDCIQPEEIKHISLCIHEHQLIKKSITDGWYRCDVCCDDMYKISYQCSKCNFDCCDVCWKGRDKRRRADNITEPPRKVSVYEYFKKLLKCHLKYKKSFIIGLILLFLHSLISLSQSSN